MTPEKMEAIIIIRPEKRKGAREKMVSLTGFRLERELRMIRGKIKIGYHFRANPIPTKRTDHFSFPVNAR